MDRVSSTARIEDLLAHADWLGRLAQGLVHDRDPEDLVQKTWARALRSPPSTDRPAQPWLASVLRNLVRNRWRGRAVREEAQEALAREADVRGPTAEDLLARAQLQKLPAELVAELEEPYRTSMGQRAVRAVRGATVDGAGDGRAP